MPLCPWRDMSVCVSHSIFWRYLSVVLKSQEVKVVSVQLVISVMSSLLLFYILFLGLSFSFFNYPHSHANVFQRPLWAYVVTLINTIPHLLPPPPPKKKIRAKLKTGKLSIFCGWASYPSPHIGEWNAITSFFGFHHVLNKPYPAFV